MKGYVIDVRGFSKEKKNKVQDALIQLGCAEKISTTDVDRYTNVDTYGDVSEYIMHGKGSMSKEQEPYEITYEKLMKEAGMNIEPEQEVTITITYRELLRAWAVLRNTSGGSFRYSIYCIAKDLLSLPDEYVHVPRSHSVIDYDSIQKELEEKVFGPKETEQQRKVRELREQAEELLTKAKELEESNND